MKYNCLIIDDEETLAESTCEYFNMFDVTSQYVCTYDDGLKWFQNNEADIVLLDINLGEKSGFKFCKVLREELDVPVLFISARDSDDDVLTAFNIGGDDYIKKPYKLSILLAKVKTMIKRFSKSSSEEDIYENKNMKVDFNTGRVSVDGCDIKLKAMEYKLLCYLIKNKGKIISKDELFQNVWQDSFTGDGTLNVHVRHIREKIEVDPNKPLRIKTVWGRGYVYEDLK